MEKESLKLDKIYIDFQIKRVIMSLYFDYCIHLKVYSSFICAEGISQAETLAFQFDAAREPELSHKA